MSAKQPVLPGMGRIPKKVAQEKERPVVSTDEFKPRKPRKKSELTTTMASGQFPMFMTAPEIIHHVNLGDTGRGDSTPVGGTKSKRQKTAENNLMYKKLRQAKTNSEENSHYRYSNQGGRTLYESLSEDGLRGSIHLYEVSNYFNSEPVLHLADQHHRLAALRNINPKQFLPVEYD